MEEVREKMDYVSQNIEKLESSEDQEKHVKENILVPIFRIEENREEIKKQNDNEDNNIDTEEMDTFYCDIMVKLGKKASNLKKSHWLSQVIQVGYYNLIMFWSY